MAKVVEDIAKAVDEISQTRVLQESGYGDQVPKVKFFAFKTENGTCDVTIKWWPNG